MKLAASREPPHYERTLAETSFITFEPRVRVFLDDYWDLRASVLVVCSDGGARSRDSVNADSDTPSD